MLQKKTFRLDEETIALLDRLSREQGRSESALVREALRRHLAAEAFRQTRRQIARHAERAGYLTDEDVFDDPDFS